MCFPFALVYLLLREIPDLSIFFNDYCSSGSSIFIPVIPDLKLFEFVPIRNQTIQLSIGHLIDIILIMNMIALIERSGYYYYEKVCLNRKYLELCTSEYGDYSCEISPEPNILFGIDQHSRYLLKDQYFTVRFNQKNNFYENYNSYNEYLRNDRFINKFVRNGILPQIKIKIHSKKKNFCNHHSNFHNFLNTLLINQNLHPQISNS
ncbi:MAG: hypothetical protein ACFFA0_08405, partial [Promethearchaeota archaeon]